MKKQPLILKISITLILYVASIFGGLAETITHDISTSSLTISSKSINDYLITGSTGSNNIIVKPGYNGSITLQNINISLGDTLSPIIIKGQDNCPNTTPISNVDFILEGDNTLEYTGTKGCVAFQVEQGTQINLSAIDPSDNTSGTLSATVTTVYSGAGIGSLNHVLNSNEATSTASVTGGTKSTGTTAGGNVIISSGTITARGGHGAGIGGGYRTYYDGMIVIYGGIVNASCMTHAAGIGSGCPNGLGVEDCYTPNSAIIVLPPAQITATGVSTSDGTVDASLALAGAKSMTYIGDPDKPLISVYTEDNTTSANIYVDLSQDEEIAKVLSYTVPSEDLDINKVKFGTTGSNGIFQFNGILQNTTTFFTDACSTSPKTLGRPYTPLDTTLTSGGTVVLKLIDTDLSLHSYPSTIIDEDYTSEEAFNNAYRIKLTYSDKTPIYNVTFEYANGNNTDFDPLIFYYADSTTQMTSAPTTLCNKDTIFIVAAIKSGKTNGEYNDVLRIGGTWKNNSNGYIRQVVKQTVATTTTVHICQDETYNFNDQTISTSGIYRDTLQSVNGKDSIVILNLTVLTNGSSNDTLYLYDYELPYGYAGTTLEAETESGDYVITTKNEWGCDSTIYLHLIVTPTFDIEIDTTHLHTCPDSKYLDINYRINYGNIDSLAVFFNSNALSSGFCNMEKQPLTNPIQITIPDNIIPDIYSADIYFNDDICTKIYSVRFAVDYPSDIIVQKWDNVLALLNSDYNGGYNFLKFQWYKDGKKLSNEIKSYIDITDYIGTDTSAIFGVETLRDDSIKLLTCPYQIKIVNTTNISIYPTVLNRNNAISIATENSGYATLWSTSGDKKLSEKIYEGINQITAPNVPGTFILTVSDGENIQKRQLIIIK